MAVSHPIVSVCSESFVLGTAALLASVLKNAPVSPGFHFHFISLDLSEASKEKLQASVAKLSAESKITYYNLRDIDGAKAVDQALTQLSLATHQLPYFAKLLAGNLPIDCPRLVFLDSDILALRNVSELFDAAPGHFCAVEDDHYRDHATDPAVNSQFTLAGCDPDTTYFNSGVFVLDIAHWKSERMFEKCLEALPSFRDYERTKPKWFLMDQVIFNVAYHSQWTPLEPHWNRQCPASLGIHHEINAGSQCLFHFIGKPKPWNLPYGDENKTFFEYLDLTAFAGQRPASTWLRWRNRLSYAKYRLHRLIKG